jgi:sugar porter (SP) family MFS transporter
MWATRAALGGFLFGYHAGVISGALLFISADFDLGDFEQGALVSILPLGAVAGGMLTGGLTHALGRRGTLLADAVVFIVGTCVAALAPTFAVLLLARGLLGFAVGVASSTVPLYVAELAPATIRGRLVTVNQLMVTLGIVVSYAVDLALTGSESWRAMLGVGLIPAVALLLGMLRAPETPYWLEAHGQSDRARQVMLGLVGRNEAERWLGELRRARGAAAGSPSAARVLTSSARPALIIGVTLAALQQLTGINTIIYYAPQIMEQTGLNASNSILYAVIIGLVNVAATAVSFRLIDRVGRRPLLIVSLAGMFVSLALLGLSFEVELGAADSWAALICSVTYISAFAIGIGPIFWLLAAEIYPPTVRASGAGIATATNWFANFVVGLAFLPLVAAIGQGPTFWSFAAVCLVTIGFVYRFVPETGGRSFAEIDAELRDRWGRGTRKPFRPA